MSKVSAEFGELIESFLERNDFTFRAAAFQSSVSAAYWKDMSDGRVPSEDIISKICKSFDDLDENALRVAAGYTPRPESMDAVTAVEFALRGQKSVSQDGVQQILDLVRELEERHGKKGGD